MPRLRHGNRPIDAAHAYLEELVEVVEIQSGLTHLLNGLKAIRDALVESLEVAALDRESVPGWVSMLGAVQADDTQGHLAAMDSILGVATEAERAIHVGRMMYAIRGYALTSTDIRLTGLSLSGGGIRSAAFGLGVIQGLARGGLLDKFKFLSGVSGGGYIASWLVTWAYRHGGGIAGVQSDLAQETTDGEEVEPVRWIRKFGMYLAPKFGLFTTDIWSLIASYLRNLILHLSAVLPVLLTVAAIPILLVAGATGWANSYSPLAEEIGHAAVGLIGVLLTYLPLRGYLRRDPTYEQPKTILQLTRGISGLTILAGLAVSLGLNADSLGYLEGQITELSTSLLGLLFNYWPFGLDVSPPSVERMRTGDIPAVLFVGVYTVFWVGIALIRRAFKTDPTPLKWMIGGVLVATSVPVVLLISLTSAAESGLSSTERIRVAIAFGPFIWALLVIVGETLLTAILADFSDARTNARWARVAGEVLKTAVLWMLVCIFSVWLPRYLLISTYDATTVVFITSICIAAFVLAWRFPRIRTLFGASLLGTVILALVGLMSPIAVMEPPMIALNGASLGP
jgi:hypothetical protein